MSERLLVTIHEAAGSERRTTVHSWPREMLFDPGLFAQTDPAQISRNGDVVTVTVSNGQATYHLLPGAAGDPRLAIPARLISARLTSDELSRLE
jgi:hypothetical protein